MTAVLPPAAIDAQPAAPPDMNQQDQAPPAYTMPADAAAGLKPAGSGQRERD
ncbi:hypothetical protein [Dactylosporangium sp. CA-092794]|uniref:hypothetical protein n=1 Tax=Dactylosporangium sp. CA-092794 TaxID=3239929 RepID=UPI003D90139F